VSEKSPLDEELSSVLADVRRHVEWQRSAGQKFLMADRSAPAVSWKAKVLPPASPAAPATSAPASAPAPAPVSAPAAPAALPPDAAAAEARVARENPALAQVRADLGDCTRCKLHGGRTHLVFGVGNPRAELVFVGEGPGADEDAQGIPFVGKAGQLLTKMIEAMGFSRDEVYICNVVKCRPPGNRNPEPDEIEACEPFLKAQLAAIKPKVIVALGKFAAQTLLRDQTPITRLRGLWREYQGIQLMPTFHPAYLLRTPADKKLAWSDLKQVMKVFGKEPAPSRGGGE
jgi:DNA polymerase